jgi:hypothetical protein
MKLTTRQLVTIAVFGTLWGASEMSLGAVFHSLKIPLASVFLATIGLILMLLCRIFVPRRGATFFTGVIAMLLKLFSIGSFVIGPMIGIIAEAIIAELVLSAFQRPTRLVFMFAGALSILWSLIQPFFTGLLIFGRDMFVVWLDLLDEGSRLLGLDTNAAVWIVLALVGIRLIIGAAGGLLAWEAGRLLQARLGNTSLASPES